MIGIPEGSVQRICQSAPSETPEEMAEYFDRLWPLLRSLTGEGLRQTHDILGELVPLIRIEVPSGTHVFDWTVPKEWVCREAYVVAPDGRRILDVKENNLHLVNYAAPFRGTVTREELEEHLYSLPSMPKAIPYVTSYYAARWGFCLSQEMRNRLPAGDYEVVVDTDHVDGSLTISEAVLPGETDEEVLFSTYTCHPSMANNELSGPLVAAFLYRRLASLPSRRLTYRLVFLPETIGSLAYLHRVGEHLKRHMIAGFVLSCLGIDAPFTLKRPCRGGTLTARAAEYVLPLFHGGRMRIRDFEPLGSDERQYCSPGFDLPVGVVATTLFREYPEYHTSLDNRARISFDALVRSVDAVFAICSVLEENRVYERTQPCGEPHFSKYGLYPTVGAAREAREEVAALLWLTQLADGRADLLEIAERSGVDFWLLGELARRCEKAGVLRERI